MIQISLKDLLTLPEFPGLGEVGIDQAEPPSTWAAQMMWFEQVLGLLQPYHILIIHFISTIDVAEESRAHPSVQGGTS
jgi:Tat protein secretion system quality control protein TatD with DNase activity